MKLFKKFGLSTIIMMTLFFSVMSHAVEKELSWNELIEMVGPDIETFHQRDIDPGMVFHHKKQRLYEPESYEGLKCGLETTSREIVLKRGEEGILTFFESFSGLHPLEKQEECIERHGEVRVQREKRQYLKKSSLLSKYSPNVKGLKVLKGWSEMDPPENSSLKSQVLKRDNKIIISIEAFKFDLPFNIIDIEFNLPIDGNSKGCWTYHDEEGKVTYPIEGRFSFSLTDEDLGKFLNQDIEVKTIR